MFKCLGKEHITSHCPNRRVMLTRGNEEVESESDRSKSEDMPHLKDCSDEEIAYQRGGLSNKACAEQANQRK